MSFAQIQPTNLSVQAGKLVELVQSEQLPEFSVLMWMKTSFGSNISETIVKYNKKKGTDLTDSYKDRVVFSNKVFSLTLKYIQKTDSGLYYTTIIGNKTSKVSQYNISVVGKCRL